MRRSLGLAGQLGKEMDFVWGGRETGHGMGGWDSDKELRGGD